jgi:hypothetical protein
VNKKLSAILLVLLFFSAPMSAQAKKKKAPEMKAEPELVQPVKVTQAESTNELTAGLGVVYNTYRSNLVSLGQYSLMAKVAATYRFESEKSFTLQFSSFFTALPFGSTQYTNRTGVVDEVKVRFLGLNLRLGYDTPLLSDPWKFQVCLGWYANTMFVTNDRFGYQWANGPQLYPTLSYRFEDRSILGGYVKYSPVLAGTFYATINYELAAGLYYHFPMSWLGDRHAVVNFDFAHLNVRPDRVQVFSNSTSLGLGVQI